MARPYPREFRDDVVRVARNRDDGVTIEQIAADFGVHPMTLSKWLRQADIDEGTNAGTTTGESAELREARRRIKETSSTTRNFACWSADSSWLAPIRQEIRWPHPRTYSVNTPSSGLCSVRSLNWQ
jgi:transposase-like protein